LQEITSGSHWTFASTVSVPKAGRTSYRHCRECGWWYSVSAFRSS